ncbi:MAG: hypothetical protein K1X92_05810 [Bacteroidia bacterium]|nr:hypothetical protein [Bacteroidia bacterium]
MRKPTKKEKVTFIQIVSDKEKTPENLRLCLNAGFGGKAGFLNIFP